MLINRIKNQTKVAFKISDVWMRAILDVNRINNECIEEIKCCKNTQNVIHLNGKKCGGRREICMRIGSARSIIVNYRYQRSANTQTDQIARMQALRASFFLSVRSSFWGLQNHCSSFQRQFSEIHTINVFYIFLSLAHNNNIAIIEYFV